MAIRKILTYVFALGILFSFFMPWADVNVDLAHGVYKITGGMDKAAGSSIFSDLLSTVQTQTRHVIPTGKRVRLSGYELARSGGSRLAGVLSEVMTFVGKPNQDPRLIQGLYGVPILGCLLAWIITNGLARMRHARQMASVISISVGACVGAKLLSVKTDTLLADIHFEFGLWVTLLFFILMGAIKFTPSKYLKSS